MAPNGEDDASGYQRCLGSSEDDFGRKGAGEDLQVWPSGVGFVVSICSLASRSVFGINSQQSCVGANRKSSFRITGGAKA